MEGTDELGVQGELLHADCLRTTYGQAQKHNLDSTQYVRPQEKWGRMPARRAGIPMNINKVLLF